MLDEQWEENFTRLLAFQKKNGHCKVRFSDEKLGNWVSEQRTYHKKLTLKPDRESRLGAVGFMWKAQSRHETIVEESDSDDELDSTHGSVSMTTPTAQIRLDIPVRH
jgi:hypothetical protein